MVAINRHARLESNGSRRRGLHMAMRAAAGAALLVACHHNDPAMDGPDGHVDGNDAAVVGDVGLDAEPVACPTHEVGSIYGHVYDQESFVPMAGVQVCIFNHMDLGCSTSDSRGVYVFPCVPVGDAELQYTPPGYPRQLWAWSSRQSVDEDVNLGFLPLANDQQFLAPTGETFPDGARSFVTLAFVGDGVVDGATVALRRGTGAGPFYTRYEGGTLDPSITSVTSRLEYAYFLAQPVAGEREIEITVTPGPSASRCSQYYGGWTAADGTPNTMRIPVEADAVSVMFIVCE
jgi:hypothetical protein